MPRILAWVVNGLAAGPRVRLLLWTCRGRTIEVWRGAVPLSTCSSPGRGSTGSRSARFGGEDDD